MNIKIHQTYFDQNQLQHLDPAFIPFDNTINEAPLLREYPLLCKLYEQNKEYDGYWGMASWRWKEKAKIDGQTLIDWMNSNPGNDVYHVPYEDGGMRLTFGNIFLQGEAVHGGLLRCMQRLVELHGLNVSLIEIYHSNYYITCHHYFTTSEIWKKLLTFLEKSVQYSHTDEIVNEFMYRTFSTHRNEKIQNFCFVMERLPALFLIANPDIKVLGYPTPQGHVPSRLR